MNNETKHARLPPVCMTLEEQIQSMALVIVDEPNKCLFYMRRWAQGTGDAHVFRWDHYERDNIYVNFYRSDGSLKAVLGPSIEWPELDQNQERADLAEWKKRICEKTGRNIVHFSNVKADFLKDAPARD
jgi:hypothetical protein